MNYLRALYTRSEVTVDGRRSVKCQRGVRQGDPLSPLLFIMVMKKVMEYSLPSLTVILPNFQAHAIAYANHLVIFSSNGDRLQQRLDHVDVALAHAAMSLNVKKSRMLEIAASGKSKVTALLPTEFCVKAGSITPMSVSEELRCMGLEFTWKGQEKVKHTAKLEGFLQNLTKLPLKPYQRVDLLRDFAMLCLLYE